MGFRIVATPTRSLQCLPSIGFRAQDCCALLPAAPNTTVSRVVPLTQFLLERSQPAILGYTQIIGVEYLSPKHRERERGRKHSHKFSRTPCTSLGRQEGPATVRAVIRVEGSGSSLELWGAEFRAKSYILCPIYYIGLI